MRRRFFVGEFSGATATLRGDAAHHAGHVLRAEPGQLYELSDGRQVWLARVERVRRDEVAFSLLEPVPAAPPELETILALSLVKFDRFEWALEKATELGAAEILPLAAARSERGLLTAAAKRALRWEKILMESAQQSRRLRPPRLLPPASDAVAFLSRPSAAFGQPQTAGAGAGTAPADPLLQLFFSEHPEAPPLRSALEHAPRSRRLLLALGPEGGWTGEERDAALRGGWAEVSLGPTILRTETAVVAALAAVTYACGTSQT
ncbi:MAG TPA: RsmE family RNA methyltransferase [Candidatus Binatia bacterium]|nr:RsmE family RNA methyltransferase [Candidatus Binatia bacterium]